MADMVYNAIRTPDGTIIKSVSRHDFNSHQDKNGEFYFVDGGLDYRRTAMNKEPAQDLRLNLGDPHEEIREVVTWGTYGKNKDGIIRNVLVKDMSNAHLSAVADLDYAHKNLLAVFNNELEYRKKNNIVVED